MKYPTDLIIYLDTKCNLNCSFCLYHNDPRKPTTPFDLSNLKKLDNAIKHAKVISFSAWGEPLISPHFKQAVDYCCNLNHSKHLIAFVTNGINLSPSLAHFLKSRIAAVDISLNAATAATYSRDMRGGNFSETLNAIQSFVRAIDSPQRVGLHFLAHANNYTEISKFIQIAALLGIRRVRVDQLMAVASEQQSSTLLIVKREYTQVISRAYSTAKALDIKFYARQFGERLLPCNSPFTEAHIWADGRVAPCCYNGSTFMGNAYNTSFEEVWDSQAYKHLRRSGIPQCASCPKILPLDDLRSHIYPMLYERTSLEK